jgi:hypothetical protein
VLGPAVPAPAPSDAQVRAMNIAITKECAGRQHDSSLVQLVGVAALVYNEDEKQYKP